MEQQRKRGRELYLPIRINEKVKFVNEAGQTCETIPRSIVRAYLGNDILYVSFLTKNSYYENVPVRVEKTGIIQDLKAGAEVCMGGEEMAHITDIYEINDKGILARTTDKKWIFGELRAS